MSKSERMKPVIRVAESREKDAAKALGESQRFLEEQLKKLEELRNYQAEYREYAQQRGAAGIAAARFLELQRFLARLDLAISEQEKMVAMAERARANRQQSWQDAHAKTKTLDKVTARFVAEEERQEARREQKSTDEIAQRRRPTDE